MLRSSFTHWNQGKWWLSYSLLYGICDIRKYDLIWFDLTWIDIPNLTLFKSRYGKNSFGFTADLQATSTFHFILLSCFRCSCSRKYHSKYVERMGWEMLLFHFMIKPHFSHSLKEEENQVLSLSKSLFVWLIATNFNHSANPIAREFHPVWQMRKITLFFSFFLLSTKSRHHDLNSFLSSSLPFKSTRSATIKKMKYG